MCKGSGAGRMSLGLRAKANRATAKLTKQAVDAMRCSLFLAPRFLDFYLLNVSPIHFSILFIPDILLSLISLLRAKPPQSYLPSPDTRI